MRGTVSALEAKVAAAESSAATSADARQNTASDAARLRAELEAATRQRDQGAAELATLRSELDRCRPPLLNIPNLQCCFWFCAVKVQLYIHKCLLFC